jgi:hypothetical protein
VVVGACQSRQGMYREQIGRVETIECDPQGLMACRGLSKLSEGKV